MSVFLHFLPNIRTRIFETMATSILDYDADISKNLFRSHLYAVPKQKTCLQLQSLERAEQSQKIRVPDQ